MLSQNITFNQKKNPQKKKKSQLTGTSKKIQELSYSIDALTDAAI